MRKLLLLVSLLVSFSSLATDKVVWFSIPATNLDQAETFYGKLFGWSFSRLTGEDGMSLSFVVKNGQMIGELYGTDTRSVGGVMVYYTLPNVAHTLTQATSLGATSLFAPMNLDENMGAIAGFIDPFGNNIGLYQESPL